MARIKHIALSLPDPEKAAQFYEATFNLKRVGETHSVLGDGIYLSDGVITLALLKYRTDEASGVKGGKDYVGVHHFGIRVDDLEAAGKEIQKNGGSFFMDLPTDKRTLDYEAKYRDPFGVLFDISHKGWTKSKP